MSAGLNGPEFVAVGGVKILLLLSLLSLTAAAQTPLVTAARSQVGKTTTYDPAYVSLKYPGGDVPLERGVCTDVVVRALRAAFSADLQKLVHEDMAAHFSAYPKKWGLKKPDKNIDHRRVPNLQKFFERRGLKLAVTQTAADYQPGDLVTCTVPPNLPHIMIVSDKKTADGRPLIIHNIGRGAQEEDCLFTYPLTGHYRWKAEPNSTVQKRGAGILPVRPASFQLAVKGASSLEGRGPHSLEGRATSP